MEIWPEVILKVLKWDFVNVLDIKLLIEMLSIRSKDFCKSLSQKFLKVHRKTPE